MFHGDESMMWGMHWAVWLFWIVVIALVVMVVGRLYSTRDRGTGPSASQILERRYAAGEISTEEYKERKDILAHKPQ